MSYGLERRLPVENGAVMTVANAQPGRTETVYRAWRKLSPDRRLAAVERRLNTAANLSDGYPPAL